MKKLFLVLGCWGILFCAVQAQKQTNIWYFGSAGLDFNSGVPVALSNSGMNSYEGCASIADRRTGRLLFYTDGVIVWNSNHVEMTGGRILFGHRSSTQSSVVVPMPGDSMKYYIFTADQGGYGGLNKGIHYSIVDMTLEGGLGAVTVKNVFLLKPATEKLAAVAHCDGISIWVIAHGWNNNNFYAWKVGVSGIADTVISSVGAVHTGDIGGTIGYLKSSPDGKRLALATYPMNLVELFDFDNSTGIISNAVTLTAAGNDYGVSFSPDNSRLYVANTYNPKVSISQGIYQFNLLAGSPVAINASRTLIFSSNDNFGALQLASDGKIYVVKSTKNTLGVINDPNLLGSLCKYDNIGCSLSTRRGSYGLPDFVESFFAQPLAVGFTYDTACAIDTVCFFGTSLQNGDRLLWRFGDQASGTSDTSTSQNPRHLFSALGTYTVTLIVERGCRRDSVSQVIIVGSRLQTCVGASAITTTTVPGDVVRLSLSHNNTKYIRAATSSSVKIAYDPQLMRLVGEPTTALGTISNFNTTAVAGELSFTVHFSDSLPAPRAEIAALYFQALLAERTTGTFDVLGASVVNGRDTITSGRCSVPFSINDNCIRSGDLRRRGNVTISGIYPNPARHSTTIAFRLAQSGPVFLEVIDIFGRSVYSTYAEFNAGEREHSINTSACSAGLYFCRLRSGGLVDIQPFFVVQ